MFACGIRVLSSETLSSCHKDSVILTDFLILNSTSQWKSVRSIWGSIVNENFQTALTTRWGSQPHAGGICCFTYHSCNNCVSLLIWFCSTWKGSVLNSYDFNLYLSKFRAGTLFFMPFSTYTEFSSVFSATSPAGMQFDHHYGSGSWS